MDQAVSIFGKLEAHVVEELSLERAQQLACDMITKEGIARFTELTGLVKVPETSDEIQQMMLKVGMQQGSAALVSDLLDQGSSVLAGLADGCANIDELKALFNQKLESRIQELADVQDQLQQSQLLTEIQVEELASVQQMHAGVQQKHAEELAVVQQMDAEELAGVQQMHAEELAGAEQMHAEELASAQQMHAEELVSLRSELEQALAQLQIAHCGRSPEVQG